MEKSCGMFFKREKSILGLYERVNDMALKLFL